MAIDTDTQTDTQPLSTLKELQRIKYTNQTVQNKTMNKGVKMAPERLKMFVS